MEICDSSGLCESRVLTNFFSTELSSFWSYFAVYAEVRRSEGYENYGRHVGQLFRVFGGVPGRGIYDNMRTAVDRVGRRKERQINARFLAMAKHYVFEPEFCNPASGWEKGQVEKNVQDARPRLWQPMPNFPDLAALNAWLERRCMELWHEIPHGALPGSLADAWAGEQAALMP